MKRFLLAMGVMMAASATVAQAQELLKAQEADRQAAMQQALTVTEASVASDDAQVVASTSLNRAPRRSVADGLYYHRPEGTLYRAGTGSTGTRYNYLLVPAYVDAVWKNMATDKAATSWAYGSATQLTDYDADENGDFVMTTPFISTGYIDSRYVPTISDNSGNSWRFTSPNVATSSLINGDSLHWNASHVNAAGGQYTGFSNAAIFGTYAGRLIQSTGDTINVMANAIYEFYDKPISPLYVPSFSFYVVSTEEDFLPADKEMNFTVRKIDENGQIGDIIADIPFTINDTVYTSVPNSTLYKKMGFFDISKKKVDVFQHQSKVPVIIEDEFVIIISGFEQDGVNFSLYMVDVKSTETDYERTGGQVQATCRSYVRADDKTSASDRLYYIQYSDTRQYNAQIFLNSMYDVVRVYDDFKEMTADVEGGNIYALVEEEDGIYKYGTLQYWTTQPRLSTWTGSKGWENYFFDDLPDWLEVTAHNDNYFADYGTTLTTITAKPLPEGMDGRRAVIHITSDKGAKSEDIVVTQGTVVEDAIVNVKNDIAAKPEAAVFNLAGQQVGAGYKGLAIENGKKVIKK